MELDELIDAVRALPPDQRQAEAEKLISRLPAYMQNDAVEDIGEIIAAITPVEVI